MAAISLCHEVTSIAAMGGWPPHRSYRSSFIY